jgi:hypothetical protein
MQANQPNQPSLNVSDLQQTAELINICTQRGAFRADELTAVGGLYDRISAFVEFTTQAEQAGADLEQTEITQPTEEQND